MVRLSLFLRHAALAGQPSSTGNATDSSAACLRDRARHDGWDLQLAQQVFEARDVLVNDLVKTLELQVDLAAYLAKNVVRLLRRGKISGGYHAGQFPPPIVGVCGGKGGGPGGPVG